MKSRRFKLTMRGTDIWTATGWDVVDTKTGEHFGPYSGSSAARNVAEKMERTRRICEGGVQS